MSENLAERQYSESSYQKPTLLNWKQKNAAVSQGDADRPPAEISKSRLARQASARNDAGVATLL